MKGNIWAVALLFIGFIVLAPALNMAYADSAISEAETETATVDYATPYTLDTIDVIEYTSLNVTANNQTLTNGTDYVFDPANATIEWQNTSATTDGDSAWVNYTYAYHDDTTEIGAEAFRGIAIAVLFVAVIATIGVIFRITGGGW